MKVKVGISNRHVHLSEKDYKLLFGDLPFNKKSDLTQSGEFSSDLCVNLIGPKRGIFNVRVLGPLRDYTQVEITKTDCYTLGVECPVASSGSLSEASLITISNGNYSIERKACIIAERHIHISPKEQEEYELFDDIYKIKVSNEKGGILDNVHVKVSDNYVFELHLDTDDANSNLINQGDLLEIIKND